MDNLKRPKKTCDLCLQTTQAEGEDLIYFGDWLTRNKITVHYYCLLLSTHLPQRGQDHAGILGFYIRDIRKEAEMARRRNCIYCARAGASLMCHGCKGYFHLTCGFTSLALCQFVGEFRSYCDQCLPPDKRLQELVQKRPAKGIISCSICMREMGYFHQTKWIYAKCCGNGFVHSRCMKTYALKAGYYLKCIWCKDTAFREDVKYMGIFVPDRDAQWEREKGAFGDLYRSHRRCDMETCYCPKGRDYSNAFRWPIVTCKLCGSFGVHNPACIPGMEQNKTSVAEFKCDTCSVTEQTICSHPSLENTDLHNAELRGINTTLHVHKNGNVLYQANHHETPEFSDDSISSFETVVNVNILNFKQQMALLNNDAIMPKHSQTQAERQHYLKVPLLTQEADPTHADGPEPSKSSLQDVRSESVCLDYSQQTEGAVSTTSPDIAELNCSNSNESDLDPDEQTIQMLVDRMLQKFQCSQVW